MIELRTKLTTELYEMINVFESESGLVPAIINAGSLEAALIDAEYESVTGMKGSVSTFLGIPVVRAQELSHLSLEA